MSNETRIDLKFYTTLFLGFSLLLIGCFIEPEGQISQSVLFGAGMILTISAGLIGVDFAKIFREVRLLKQNIIDNKNEVQK